MRLIEPFKITDAKLTAHSVPENDHPVWSAATSYAIGNRVIRAQTHRIYPLSKNPAAEVHVTLAAKPMTVITSSA